MVAEKEAMDDEIRQIRANRFNHIILSLVLLGLVAGLVTALVANLASPWFWRAVTLLLLALVALVLHHFSRFVVAAYALVLALVALVASLLPANAPPGFSPYLFMPIIVIAGLILNPAATLGVGILAAILLLVSGIFTAGWLTPAYLNLVALPVVLILFTALLAAENGRYLDKLAERLVEGRLLLRQRTLELLEVLQELKKIRRTAAVLEHEVKARVESYNRQPTSPGIERLYGLITGAVQELDLSIKGFRRVIDQISERPEPDEYARLLEEAWQKVDDLTHLVVNLQEMAQLDSSAVELNYQPVDIRRLLAEMAGTTRGLAREKELEVRCQVLEELPPVPADPVRLRQALLYLLDNAVRYTDQGTIEIQAELDNGELLIFISDTGIGMQHEEKALVFEKFVRGRGTLAKQRQGTGLGLAISRGLIELHGGRMWVTSVLGVGSTFYMTLPLTRPQATPPVGASDLVSTIISRANMLQRIDPAPSLVRTAPALPTGSGVYSSLGPVARFSSTYIGRFTVILLVLLLLLVGTAAALAFFNSPVTGKRPAATTGPASSRTSPTVSPAEAKRVTATVDLAIALPTPSRPPAATAAPLPTTTSSPTPTPRPAPTLTPAELPVTVPLSVTPTAPLSATPPPAPTATAHLTPTATSLPEPATSPPAPTPVIRPSPPLVRPRLAFTVAQAGRYLGAVIDLNGHTGARWDSLAVETVDGGRLSWSPDGQKVLFTTARDGNLEIYVVDARCEVPSAGCGNQAWNLTRSTGDDSQPAWSPDGRLIAFSSGRTGNFEIYALAAACAASSSVACPDSPVMLTTSPGFDEWPAWSPDGRQLAFVSDRDGNVEIYTMGADGSDQQRLTHSPAADWPVAWSPDGRWLLFASDRDGNWNLYLVEAGCAGRPDGCESRTFRLTSDPADEREPAWSPTGRTIAFASNRNGNWDIYTLPLPPGSLAEVPASAWHRITDFPGDERYPVWAP